MAIGSGLFKATNVPIDGSPCHLPVSLQSYPTPGRSSGFGIRYPVRRNLVQRECQIL